jgi:hypothetical protein
MQRVFISFALLAGCVADAGDESFIIRSNLAPPTSGGECLFIASIDAPAIARGQIFLDGPNPYVMNPLFESRITAADGRESLRTIFLEGANVDLQIGPIEIIDSAGGVTVDETVESQAFRSLFSSPLPPNGGVTAAQFDLVPLSVLLGIKARTGAGANDRVHAQISATITAFGDYYGEPIESSPFTFPVVACNDCVIGNRGIDGTFPACSTFTQTARLGNPCNVFQDGVVDCCDTGNGIQCPAITSAPMP